MNPALISSRLGQVSIIQTGRARAPAILQIFAPACQRTKFRPLPRATWSAAPKPKPGDLAGIYIALIAEVKTRPACGCGLRPFTPEREKAALLNGPEPVKAAL
jgi:hypothetical protein